MIIAIFCPANTNRDNGNDALGSSYSQLENSKFNLMRNCIFCSEWQSYYTTINLATLSTRTMSELPEVGAKLGHWASKMFHNFLFLQSDVVFWIINAFSLIFDAVSSKKSCLTSMLFLLTYIEFRQLSFSRLLNSNWSIQISGAAAVCKRSS